MTEIENAANVSDLESDAISLMTGSLEEESVVQEDLPHQNPSLSVNDVEIEETDEIISQSKELVEKGSFNSGIIAILFN